MKFVWPEIGLTTRSEPHTVAQRLKKYSIKTFARILYRRSYGFGNAAPPRQIPFSFQLRAVTNSEFHLVGPSGCRSHAHQAIGRKNLRNHGFTTPTLRRLPLVVLPRRRGGRSTTEERGTTSTPSGATKQASEMSLRSSAKKLLPLSEKILYALEHKA